MAMVLAASLTFVAALSDILVDWTWFSALGYVDVFWIALIAKVALFTTVLVASTTVLLANGWLALHFTKGPAPLPAQSAWGSVPGVTSLDLWGRVRGRLSAVVAGAAVVVSFLIAWAKTSQWNVLLRFLFQVPFGRSDPVYGKDISFYLFSLPVYLSLKNWLLLTTLFSALIAGVVYWERGCITIDQQRLRMAPAALVHVSALLAILFAVKAWSYYLDRFLLLYDDNGVVVGASYTDLTMGLPVLWVLIGLSGIAAVASLTNLQARTYRLPLAAVVLVFGGSFVLGEVTPVVFQRLFVKPNELELEKPYLQHNIALTRRAYNLHHITAKPVPAEQTLTLASVQANQATIDNIRLWDGPPLMDAYRQLQEIRTYYKFHDVDVDRYLVNGAAQQLMLSARELNSALLPSNAQTWVNRHVLFTHGYGAIVSPVTRKSSEGLPTFYVSDIPPATTAGPTVVEPRIYYGELTDTYVIVKGSTPEFDYPKGKENVYAAYAGSGGVPVGGIARRALFAWYFADPNILISRYITGESRIMFRRTIQERVQTIAPFLRLDQDPYLVISEGRLFWIVDAYTTSRYFPYAQPASQGELNYIRNSVKVVVDAYNGSVDFYLADASDPIAATYGRAFPHLLKPLTPMPPDLPRHIRYPQDLFFIQAQVYRPYHMTAAEVFYNREDLWELPRQAAGGNAIMDPYYMIMRLPGEPKAEFILMVPMVPSQRENMIAWLAARCDPPHYGELIVYEFPKDKLVFGPFQIDARINQNTTISQQLSLWNQHGSRVIRGNLHVIPIEDAILYVSPLYLRAESGQIPELKRVIAAYGDHVVMAESLPGALAALFPEAPPASPPPALRAETSPAGPMDTRAHEALGHYDRALERLKAGDWSGFRAELDGPPPPPRAPG